MLIWERYEQKCHRGHNKQWSSIIIATFQMVKMDISFQVFTTLAVLNYLQLHKHCDAGLLLMWIWIINVQKCPCSNVSNVFKLWKTKWFPPFRPQGYVSKRWKALCRSHGGTPRGETLWLCLRDLMISCQLQPTHNTATGALVYSNHGTTLMLFAWLCVDF